MKQATTKELFEFIVKQVRTLAHGTGLQAPQAFPRWFAEMYYSHPQQMVHADGPGDGKIDLFFNTLSGNSVTRHVINSKFTDNFGQTAPVGFYDEILSFYRLFSSDDGRDKFLKLKVKKELHAFYKTLFKSYA